MYGIILCGTLSAASRVKLWKLVQRVSGHTLSHHPAQCAVRFDLVAPAAQVWHAAPGQKNRKVLSQLVYKVLVSIKFNMTFIYLTQKGIMCLLDDVVLWVQAPHEEELEEATARAFYGGSCS